MADDPATISMYQGEDWEQQLSYFTDEGQTQPLVFDEPVMDIRGPRTRLATFDVTGTQEGLATITGPGVLVLSLPWANTVDIPAGTYPLDIFANVAGKRRAITKVGTIQLVVSARSTQDSDLT